MLSASEINEQASSGIITIPPLDNDGKDLRHNY